MKSSTSTRVFAEAMGQAIAFGVNVTRCDVFNNSTHNGFVHGVRNSPEVQVDIKNAFTSDTHLAWRKLMYDTETLAYKRGHTPCTYGTRIYRIGDRLFMSIARHFNYVDDALNGAEAEMTESAVYRVDEPDTPIYLEENNRVPGTHVGFSEAYEKYEYENVPYDEDYNARRAGRIAEAYTRLSRRV